MSYTVKVESRCPPLPLGQATPFVDFFHSLLSFSATTQSSTPKKQSLISSAPHTLLITLLILSAITPKTTLVSLYSITKFKTRLQPGVKKSRYYSCPGMYQPPRTLGLPSFSNSSNSASPLRGHQSSKTRHTFQLGLLAKLKSLILYSSCGVATS